MRHVRIPAGQDAGTLHLTGTVDDPDLSIEAGEGARAVLLEGCTNLRSRKAAIDLRVGTGADVKLAVVHDSALDLKADGGRVVLVTLDPRRLELAPACRFLGANLGSGRTSIEGMLDLAAWTPAPDQLAFLKGRGVPEKEAQRLLLSAYFAPVAKELPVELAVELERLIDLILD